MFVVIHLYHFRKQTSNLYWHDCTVWIDWSIDRSIDRSIACLIDWLIDQSIDWSSGWVGGWASERASERGSEWLIDWVRRMVSQVMHRSSILVIGQSLGTPVFELVNIVVQWFSFHIFIIQWHGNAPYEALCLWRSTGHRWIPLTKGH